MVLAIVLTLNAATVGYQMGKSDCMEEIHELQSRETTKAPSLGES